MSIIDDIKAKMNAAFQHFKEELKKLRTGRANPAVLDTVSVEVYGTRMRLKELATVSSPEPRQLLVTPFDPQTAPAISKGIEEANLNLQPKREGNIIRINVPPMDEAMRKNIVKQGKEKAEASKVTIRDIRRKGNEGIRKEKADGRMTEDEMKKNEKIVQDLTDKFCKEIDDAFVAKEKEIMTV